VKKKGLRRVRVEASVIKCILERGEAEYKAGEKPSAGGKAKKEKRTLDTPCGANGMAIADEKAIKGNRQVEGVARVGCPETLGG